MESKKTEGYDFHYIMVTHWNGFWDNVDQNPRYPYYPLSYLKGITTVELKDNTPTTFIKLNQKGGEPSKAWEGRVHSIRTDPDHKVYFNFDLGDERSLDDIKRYIAYKGGWYIEPVGCANVDRLGSIASGSNLQPPIFEELMGTTEWGNFENYTHYLIRLLGIHAVYKFDNQRGSADGFFKFNNLAVIYDCTLEDNYDKEKRQQIKNYCDQLKRGSIEVTDNAIEEFHTSQKQVWLITRGKSRMIRTVNDIAVKEVYVGDLIDIYEYRLRKMVGENELENELRNIARNSKQI